METHAVSATANQMISHSFIKLWESNLCRFLTERRVLLIDDAPDHNYWFGPT